jgi:hypothetical protein
MLTCLRINTDHIRARAMYLEAAIATRLLNHMHALLKVSPVCSMSQLLDKPEMFVKVSVARLLF